MKILWKELFHLFIFIVFLLGFGLKKIGPNKPLSPKHPRPHLLSKRNKLSKFKKGKKTEKKRKVSSLFCSRTHHTVQQPNWDFQDKKIWAHFPVLILLLIYSFLLCPPFFFFPQSRTSTNPGSFCTSKGTLLFPRVFGAIFWGLLQVSQRLMLFFIQTVSVFVSLKWVGLIFGY